MNLPIWNCYGGGLPQIINHGPLSPRHDVNDRWQIKNFSAVPVLPPKELHSPRMMDKNQGFINEPKRELVFLEVKPIEIKLPKFEPVVNLEPIKPFIPEPVKFKPLKRKKFNSITGMFEPDDY